MFPSVLAAKTTAPASTTSVNSCVGSVVIVASATTKSPLKL